MLHAGFTWSLKVFKIWGNGICFSRPWKSVKTEWRLWKFVVFRVLGENYRLLSQKLHFPGLNRSSVLFFCFLNAVWNHKEHTYQFWLIECKAIGCSKGCAPLPDVWKSCVPSCCFSVPCCKGLWKVCELWKDFSVWTLSILASWLMQIGTGFSGDL